MDRAIVSALAFAADAPSPFRHDSQDAISINCVGLFEEPAETQNLTLLTNET